MRKVIAIVILVAFISTSVKSPAYAQVDPMPFMPKPGIMVHLSPEYTPAYLKGIVIHPENALKFDFIIYKGDKELTEDQKKVEYTKLTKYFLASLAIPDDDQWVNLSPYEKDRIIKDDFGKTEMGRDLLAQDYMLKQITASLIYPEDNLGKKFWDKVYAQAQEQFGTSNIPVNTFNKVWILPDDALIYEKGNTAYVLKNHLRVMLEEDYLSLQKHSGITSAVIPDAPTVIPAKAGIHNKNNINTLGSKIVHQIVLPELEREVNEGKNFAALRQVYSGMLLAAWYKRALKESLLSKIYANKAKVKGVDQDPKTNEQIYQQYLRAYKKGVFNFIKEDVDKYTNETIPRKYFSGGTEGFPEDQAMFARIVHEEKEFTPGQAQEVREELVENKIDYAQVAANVAGANPAMNNDAAMIASGEVFQTEKYRQEVKDQDRIDDADISRIRTEVIYMSQRSRPNSVTLLLENRNLTVRKMRIFLRYLTIPNIPANKIRYRVEKGPNNYLNLTIDMLADDIKLKEKLDRKKKGNAAMIANPDNVSQMLLEVPIGTKVIVKEYSEIAEVTGRGDNHGIPYLNVKLPGGLEIGGLTVDRLIFLDEKFVPLPTARRVKADSMTDLQALLPRGSIIAVDEESLTVEVIDYGVDNKTKKPFVIVKFHDGLVRGGITVDRIRKITDAAMSSYWDELVGPRISRAMPDNVVNLFKKFEIGKSYRVYIKNQHIVEAEVLLKSKKVPLEGPDNVGRHYFELPNYAGGSYLHNKKYVVLTFTEINAAKEAKKYSLSMNPDWIDVNNINEYSPLVEIGEQVNSFLRQLAIGQSYRVYIKPQFVSNVEESESSPIAESPDKTGKRYIEIPNLVSAEYFRDRNKIKFNFFDTVIRHSKDRTILKRKMYSHTMDVDWIDLKKVNKFNPETGDPFNPAMATTVEPGGIDFNAANLNLQIKRDGKGVPLPFAQQDMAQLNLIEGLEPVILSIKPANSLPIFSNLLKSVNG